MTDNNSKTHLSHESSGPRGTNNSVRNIAIIAHVDHGKTTLVDLMLKQAGTFREGQEVADRVMDRLDLERERGITIAAKNCAVMWKGTKINVLDTPGHADFGGEVERALHMVDGAILLVDASEGPLPQTRFVLKKALEARLAIIVVVNKIDRGDARPAEVLDEIYELFMDLDATDDQIEFPVIYAIGRDGKAFATLEQAKDPESSNSLAALFDKIVETVPPPSFEVDAPFQMLVSNIGYSEFLGRLAVGRVANGQAKKNEEMICIDKTGKNRPLRVSQIQVYRGLALDPVDQVTAGDVVILSGIDEVEIGDTICKKDQPRALKRISVEEPTIAMRFGVNTSPLAGREGKFVQSRNILERLKQETLTNVAIQVEENSDDSFTVKGRGEFQLAIVIETMRREGYELSVGRPNILMKEVDGEKHEPIEHLFIDCDETFTGIVTEKLSTRKGRLINLVNKGSGRVRLEFSIPSRGLIGYRSEFLTDTKGTGIMNSILLGFEPYRGDFPVRVNGSLVSDRDGEAVAYGLFHLEPRGRMFVAPGDKLYTGMVIGEHNRPQDLHVNACRMKKLSNMRASGKDEHIVLTPVQPMTLEQAIEFINDDEMVEVTPKNIRLRKISLGNTGRSS